MKAIITKFHGPTNTRGSRISATDSDGNRVMVSSDHSLTSDGKHDAAALALCAKMKWHGTLQRGWIGNQAVYVFVDERSTITV